MSKITNKVEWIIKEFNELNIHELYEILKLRNEIFILEQNCIYQDVDDNDKSAYHIFSMDNNNLCSYVRVLKKGSKFDEISIGRVLTSKNYRGKGLSKTTIILALDFIKISFNKPKVKISAQEYLVDFYNNLGFEKISESYLEDNIPHVEMIIDLKNWKLSR